MKANLEAKMTFSITFFSLSTKILANNLYKFPSKLIGLRLLDPLPHAFSWELKTEVYPLDSS